MGKVINFKSKIPEARDNAIQLCKEHLRTGYEWPLELSHSEIDECIDENWPEAISAVRDFLYELIYELDELEEEHGQEF